MRRLAENDRRWFEKTTEDGTVVWAELECREPIEEGEECGESMICMPPEDPRLEAIARERL